jgi:Family of unknown function (DUF5317)
VIVVLLAAGLAILAGVMRGGTLRNLSEVQVRALAILWVGVMVQIAFDIWNPEWLGPGGGLAALLASNVLIAAFFWLNRELPGAVLAAIGFLFNVIVIALNGAMPVSRWAAEVAGAGDTLPVGLKHEWSGNDTILPWLADVIPVPFGSVVSVGDLVLGAGIAWFVYSSTLRTNPDRLRATERASD